ASNLYQNSDDAIAFAGKPPRRLADAQLFGLDALYRLYECREHWVFLACPSEREWQRLCALLGRPELATDAHFATAAAGQQNDAALAAALSDAFCTRTAAEWERLLGGAGLGCVVADAGLYGDFFNTDPLVEEIGLGVDVPHAIVGHYRRSAPF